MQKETKQVKLIRRDPLVIFSLIIGVLLLAILYLIVENVILRYIFLVFALSFFSGLFFYDVFKIMGKKDLGIYLLVALLCGLYVPWIFSFVHELSHAITAIITGIKVIGIEVYYPYGGYVFLSPHIIAERYFWVPLSGSLGSISITYIFNRIIYHIKTIKFSIFFPLFMITSWRILVEVFSWIIGVDYFIKGLYDIEHDAVSFLYLFPSNPVVLGSYYDSDDNAYLE